MNFVRLRNEYLRKDKEDGDARAVRANITVGRESWKNIQLPKRFQ